MRDHGSIGLLREWCFGEEFGSECLGLFLFCFCLVRGNKVASAQDFGWQSKGEDHFRSWFPFFFVSSPFLRLGIFLLFVFSSEGKDYGELGFWLKACRTTGHDICQGLASGSGIKGMYHIIFVIHMQ